MHDLWADAALISQILKKLDAYFSQLLFMKTILSAKIKTVLSGFNRKCLCVLLVVCPPLSGLMWAGLSWKKVKGWWQSLGCLLACFHQSCRIDVVKLRVRSLLRRWTSETITQDGFNDSSCKIILYWFLGGEVRCHRIIIIIINSFIKHEQTHAECVN